MKPYYATSDGMVRVFNARWQDVVASGVVRMRDVGLIAADPPYGQGLTFRGRGGGRKVGRCTTKTKEREWEPMAGENEAFDPSELLALDKPLVTWGANHYASRLPVSPSWLYLDKRDDGTPDDGADGEIAWSNLGGPLRQFTHLWRGTCRASECAAAHLHPTQKPEALMAWEFARAMERRRLKRGGLIFVPYGGSMPEIRAALAIGCRVIACEVSRTHCRTAVSARLQAVVHDDVAEDPGPLFGGELTRMKPNQPNEGVA